MYAKHFDGKRLLVPAVNPSTDLQILPLFDKKFVHGLMVCDFLPVCLAFPVVAAILCGPDDAVYLESLIDYISA